MASFRRRHFCSCLIAHSFLVQDLLLPKQLVLNISVLLLFSRKCLSERNSLLIRTKENLVIIFYIIFKAYKIMSNYEVPWTFTNKIYLIYLKFIYLIQSNILYIVRQAFKLSLFYKITCVTLLSTLLYYTKKYQTNI